MRVEAFSARALIMLNRSSIPFWSIEESKYFCVYKPDEGEGKKSKILVMKIDTANNRIMSLSEEDRPKVEKIAEAFLRKQPAYEQWKNPRPLAGILSIQRSCSGRLRI